MKHTYRFLSVILSVMLLLGLAGCDHADPSRGETNQLGQASSLEEIPPKHRPESSDPKAIKAHGITLSATYAVPNGVELSVAMRDGSDRGSLTVSRQPIFERYENGTWVRMAGQEGIDPSATMDTAHFAAPLELDYALPCFPEAGVYRLSLLCGGEMTAEHYAYFEVPTYTLTVPTEEDCAKAVEGSADGSMLKVEAKDVTSNGLTLVLTAKTADGELTVSYGRMYRILCHVNGEWQPVAMHRNVFEAIGILTEIKGEHEMKIGFGGHFYPLESGYYRLEKEFNGATYFVCFEIAE